VTGVLEDVTVGNALGGGDSLLLGFPFGSAEVVEGGVPSGVGVKGSALGGVTVGNALEGDNDALL